MTTYSIRKQGVTIIEGFHCLFDAMLEAQILTKDKVFDWVDIYKHTPPWATYFCTITYVPPKG